MLRQFAAVKLRYTQPEHLGDLRYARRVFIYEYSYFPYVFRDLADPFGEDYRFNKARAVRTEIEPDGVRATLDGRSRILQVRKPANLYEQSSSLKAVEGSPDFMRCSPTRNA